MTFGHGTPEGVRGRFKSHESGNEIYDFEDEISAKLNRNLEVNSSPFGSQVDIDSFGMFASQARCATLLFPLRSVRLVKSAVRYARPYQRLPMKSLPMGKQVRGQYGQSVGTHIIIRRSVCVLIQGGPVGPISQGGRYNEVYMQNVYTQQAAYTAGTVYDYIQNP